MLFQNGLGVGGRPRGKRAGRGEKICGGGGLLPPHKIQRAQ